MSPRPAERGEGGRRPGEGSDFLRVFEHFAANLALWGGLLLISDGDTFEAGCIVTIVLAAAVIAWGFAQKSEPFVLYAFVYGVIAADALLIEWIEPNTIAVLLTLIVSMIAAVAGLVALHRRFRGSAA
ncbi:MAG TPA: hypothetical protein VHL59_07930 [Thermoanaerobaculia bacterium]|nr:hypothetical protein [Thermoanaerobaculia bacterium]